MLGAHFVDVNVRGSRQPVGREDAVDCGLDSVCQPSDVHRQRSRIRIPRVDGGANRPAPVVGEHKNQVNLEGVDRILERPDDGGGDGLTNVSHDEQIAESDVENDFRAESRIRAPKQRGERCLFGGDGASPRAVLVGMRRRSVDKPVVSVPQPHPRAAGRFRRPGHRDASTDSSARIATRSISADDALPDTTRVPRSV